MPRKKEMKGAASMLAARGVVTAAAILGGLLAGDDVDRSFVQMHAWKHLGSRRWAEYSQHADLERGLFLYPFEGIGGAALTLLAAVMICRLKTSRRAQVASCAAAAFALGGMAVTTRAAPIMLSMRHAGEESDDRVREAFAGFRRWGNIRATFQLLAFLANVATLALLSGNLQAEGKLTALERRMDRDF